VIIGTVLEATAFLFEIPTGVVADTFSRRLSVIIGIALIGAGIALEGYLPLFAVVLVGQVVSGIGYTFISGATDAWIADEVGEEHLAQVFMRAGQVGRALGIAGAIASIGLASINLALPIALGGSLLASLSIVLVFIMPETGFKPAPREGRTTWQAMGHTFIEGTRLVRRRPSLTTFLLIELFVGLASEGWDRLVDAHFLTTFTFPTFLNLQPVVWIGGMSLVGGLLSIPAVEFARRRINMQNRQSVVRAVSVFSALKIGSILLCAFAPGFYLALVGRWGNAVFGSIQGPLYGAWLNQSIDSNVRATVLSMSSQFNAFGQITGGPAVGAIGNSSIRWALGLSGILLAPTIPLYARAHRQGPEQSEATAVALEAQAEG
jgi:DHA3 family tetracycline resistance protein-like MFS transporter